MNNKAEKKTLNVLESYRNELSSFRDRLKGAIKSESVKGFAASVGVSEGALRNLLSGGIPRLDTLLAISHKTGQSLEYLATGQEDQGGSEEFACIKKIHLEVSAGHGSQPPEYEAISKNMAFRRDWLKSKGLREEKLAILVAKGDSMEPTIPDGSMLLVDTDDIDPGDGIYIVKVDGHLFAKRIQRLMDGAIKIISDNKAYDEITITKETVGDIDVKGKVVWFGRDL